MALLLRQLLSATLLQNTRVLASLLASVVVKLLYSRGFGVDVEVQAVEKQNMTMPQVEGYQIVRCLGVGPYADVYEATRGTREGTETLWLKVVRAAYGQDHQFTQQFLAYSQVAHALDHPRIARLIDAGESNGTLYMAMEQRAALPLQLLLTHARGRQKPFSLSETLHISLQMLEGLQYLARQVDDQDQPKGLFHGNFKPSNIFIDSQGEVYLTDLGCPEPGQQLVEDVDQDLKTQNPNNYRPPELHTVYLPSPDVDLYAVGAIMYEMLTLRTLSTQSNTPLNDVLSELQTSQPNIYPILWRAISDTIVNRFNTPEEFSQLLRPLHTDGGAQSRCSTLIREILAALAPLDEDDEDVSEASTVIVRPSQAASDAPSRADTGLRRTDLTAFRSPSGAIKEAASTASPSSATSGIEAGTAPDEAGTARSNPQDDMAQRITHYSRPAAEINATIDQDADGDEDGGEATIYLPQGQGDLPINPEATIALMPQRVDQAVAAQQSSDVGPTNLTSPGGADHNATQLISPDNLPQTAILPEKKRSRRLLYGAMGVLIIGMMVVVFLKSRVGSPPQSSEPSTAVARLAPPPAQAKPGRMLWIRNSEMVEIPGGTFYSGEGKRLTQVDTFFIDRYEVTNLQFLAFLAACPQTSACAPPEVPEYLTSLSVDELNSVGLLPVTSVSWSTATAYARWAGKRLPSITEWEKAARGVDARRYPWGKTALPVTEMAWVNAPPGYAHSRPLNLGAASVLDPRYRLDRSPYGMFGTAGNVNEWTATEAAGGGNRFYVAGGTWGTGGAGTGQTTQHQLQRAQDQSGLTGFRCAMDPTPALDMGQPLTLNLLQHTGRLRVGTRVRAPMLITADDGSHSGFEYQLAMGLADQLAVQLEMVEIHDQEPAALLAANKIDIIINSFIPSPQFTELAWTSAYLNFGQCLVVRAKAEIQKPSDLANRTIAILNDPTARRTVIEMVPDVGKILQVDTDPLGAVVSRQADAAVYDLPLAQSAVQNHSKRLKIVQYNLTRSSYHVGIRQGEWSLLQSLDQALKTILASDEYVKDAKTYLGGSLAVGWYGLHRGKMVLVESGEDLPAVALRVLGSRAKAAKLLQANRSWLRTSSQVQPGMYVRLP